MGPYLEETGHFWYGLDDRSAGWFTLILISLLILLLIDMTCYVARRSS